MLAALFKTKMAAVADVNIVIFKSNVESDAPEHDSYYEVFRSAGYNVTFIPVLDFEFSNLNELLAKIKNPDNYSGIIFSSPRCVKSVELCLQTDPDTSILEKWRNHRNYVVGEKTGKLADDLGLMTLGKEAGNSDALADIISKDVHLKPFLYPVGSLTSRNFQLKLKEKSIEVDKILIYNTLQHPKLQENIVNANDNMHKTKIVYIIYFSPSGVNFTLPLLKSVNLDLNKVKFIAIGPATEQSIKSNGLEVAATSTAPNPESLLKSVIALHKL